MHLWRSVLLVVSFVERTFVKVCFKLQCLNIRPMFDPSEPTEEELHAARDVLLEELRAKAKRRADEMGDDPFQDAAGLIMAVHAEKVYQYELQRRREAL